MEDDAKREPGLLLPAPKQLRAVIVDLSHADGEKAEVPVDTASTHKGEACLLAKSPIGAASTWEHMCEQSKVPGAVKELGPEEEIVLMTLASRRGLMMRIKVGVKAEPSIESLANGKLPAAGLLLQVTLVQGIAGKDMAEPDFLCDCVSACRCAKN